MAQSNSLITKEQEAALKAIEGGFVDIAGMQEQMGIGSYQYARTLVVEDRFGLGTNSVTLFGRTLVSTKAIEAAKKMRSDRKDAKVAAASAPKKAKKGKKKDAEEPDESLDDLIS
jgi:hypothetical protein